jgi:hypothetical protein
VVRPRSPEVLAEMLLPPGAELRACVHFVRELSTRGDPSRGLSYVSRKARAEAGPYGRPLSKRRPGMLLMYTAIAVEKEGKNAGDEMHVEDVEMRRDGNRQGCATWLKLNVWRGGSSLDPWTPVPSNLASGWLRADTPSTLLGAGCEACSSCLLPIPRLL